MSRTGPISLWAPVGVWMAIIWLLSAQSDLTLPTSVTDKQGHSLGYAGLGGLITRAVVGGLGRPVALTHAVAAIGGATAYGVVDEWHQSHVPGRMADAADVWADFVGSAIGTAVCWVWGTMRPRADA